MNTTFLKATSGNRKAETGIWIHFRFLLSPFYLCYLISPFQFSAAAAPPPELTLLCQYHEKSLAERVTAPFDAQVAELNGRFTGALDKAIAQAKSAGDLATVLALQEDKERVANAQPLPEDTESTPPALQNLRSIYRIQLAKLEEQRAANHAALLAPHIARLKDLEATLTKADRVEEARQVMEYRVGLAASAPPSAAPAVTASAPEPAPPASSVRGDDRKAAEWVLSVGGAVSLEGYGGNPIRRPEDLPKGRFRILRIELNNNQGGIKPFSDADLAVLAGLQALEEIVLNQVPITHAAFDILCSCPILNTIGVQYNALGDQLWSHLAGMRKLEILRQGFDRLPVQGIGIAHLNRETIQELGLGNNPIVDAALSEIATLTKLTYVNLEATKVTDEGIKSLAALTELTDLNLRGTAVTSAGLAALMGLPVKSLGYGRTMSEMTAQAAEVAAVFPKIQRLSLPREVNPTPDEWSMLARAFPKLGSLQVTSHKFAGDACAGIAALENLGSLHFIYCPISDAGVAHLAQLKHLKQLRMPDAHLTDASFGSLAKMKSLKEVRLPKPGDGLTPEGLAAFKKQRPDVNVQH